MIQSQIIDPSNSKTVEVTDDHFLAVKNTPYYDIEPTSLFFSNPTYGVDMNIFAAPSGSAINIHDGEDNSYWTAVSVVGSWDFSSTDQANTGTQSIDGTSETHNSVAEFDRGSDLDLTDYGSLEGYIYITGWSVIGTKEVNVYGWDTGLNAIVGNTVNIGNYVDTGSLNIWQKFSIPLTDMGISTSTIDSIRIGVISLGGGLPPDFYLDDIAFISNQFGTSQEYSLLGENDRIYYIHEMKISMVAPYDSTLTDATGYKLSYNDLLGQTLVNGQLYRFITEDNEILFAIQFKRLIDFIQLPGMKIDEFGSDGTNTFLTMSYNLSATEPIELKPNEKISFTLNDDMTNFLFYRILARVTYRSYSYNG